MMRAMARLESSNQVLGKYTLKYRVAVGGMGEVFYATSSIHPKGAIVKALLPDLASEQVFVAQFLDEARLSRVLNHPNIVSTYDVGPWQGTYVLAMEYVHGRDLLGLLKRAKRMGRLVPPMVAGQIIRDAAEALHFAHNATDASGRPLNIVHRDVSPSNIMTSLDGVSKVLDFGIASALGKASRTATGIVKGKLSYMSPQQAAGQTINASADQYALGLVFWELLCARRARDATNDVSLLTQVIDGTISTPSSKAPGIPPAIEAVVMKMLSKTSAERFKSCQAVADALGAVLPGDARAQVKTFIASLGVDDLQDSAPPRASAHLSNMSISLSTPTALEGAWPRDREQELTVEVQSTQQEPMPQTRLLRMEEYLSRLPNGLDSYPEMQQKASIMPSFLQGVPIHEHLDALPPVLASLVRRPASATSWVSEIQATCVYLACVDLCFSGPQAYVAFAYEANKRIIDGPLYSIMFRMLGPRRIVDNAAHRWGAIHRGTTLEVTSFTPGALTFIWRSPPHGVPPLIGQCQAEGMRGVFEVAGCKDVAARADVISPTEMEIVCTWRKD